MLPDGALLSFSGKSWKFLDEDNDDLVRTMVAIHDVPEVSARIMVNRGITNHGSVGRFLNARIKDIMPDPLLIHDMKEAIDRISEAIINNEKIFVFGDYDVDGIVSVYLVVDYLKKLGVDVTYRIPSRFDDGYGISTEAIEKVFESGAELLIIVDSGTNSIDEINAASRRGLDCVVVDHHTQLSSEIPDAIAVVNPNRNDQGEIGDADIKCLCAAGVVYMLLIALQRQLRDAGFFGDSGEPNLIDYVGVVALGTLCDVMKVTGLNRAYINLAMKTQKFPKGIEALIKASSIDKISSPDDFSFVIGPAINAAGRIHDPSIVIDMLLSENDNKTIHLAEQLIDLNNTRKRIEKKMLEEAISMVNENGLYNDNAIFVYNKGWHGGVIGIAASKLKDRFSRPTFVATFGDNGIGIGSARSSENDINVAYALSEAVSRGILISGGGHSMAGGFSLPIENAVVFRDFLNSNFRAKQENILNIDCSVPKSINLKKLSDCVALLEPYGKGVEPPVFCMKNLLFTHARYTQLHDHIIVCFKGEWNSVIRTIIFNADLKENIVKLMQQNSNKYLDLAFSVRKNEKYGVSIVVEDLRLSEPDQRKITE
ncbi:MAG: single-stranded-DNA-specific exonuclease RecJ [Holosporales bacterium]|jgi:single-stranded-DNA-specific exonuclease|nr:single-stranded-DNA-specific exonuclease RecJ [Holosporales bacterium]